MKWSTLPRGSQSSFFFVAVYCRFESERTGSRLLCIITQVSNVFHLLLWQYFHFGQTNQWQEKEVIDKFFFFPRTTLLFFPELFFFSRTSSFFSSFPPLLCKKNNAARISLQTLTRHVCNTIPNLSCMVMMMITNGQGKDLGGVFLPWRWRRGQARVRG